MLESTFYTWTFKYISAAEKITVQIGITKIYNLLHLDPQNYSSVHLFVFSQLLFPFPVYFKLFLFSHVIHSMVPLQLLRQQGLLLLLCQGKWIHHLMISFNFLPWTYIFIYIHTHYQLYSSYPSPVQGKPLVLCPWRHFLLPPPGPGSVSNLFWPLSGSLCSNLWLDLASPPLFPASLFPYHRSTLNLSPIHSFSSYLQPGFCLSSY